MLMATAISRLAKTTSEDESLVIEAFASALQQVN